MLIALKLTIHATGIVLMALAVVRIRVWAERHHQKPFRSSHLLAITIALVGVAGLLLAALHGIEAALWAPAYWWLGALDSLPDAILYSVDSIRTRGASGLVPAQHWRGMGSVEAMGGMLLFGISTAYIFAVMQFYWSFVTQHRR